MTSRFAKAFVISAAGAFGVFVFGACDSSSGSDQYYCDNSGCYSCDAYGCSGVSAPGHPACTSASSCGGGLVCTTTGCTASCTSDTQCSKGETCQTGLCSPPGTPPGSIIGADGGGSTTINPDGGPTTTNPDGGTISTPCGTGPACTGTNLCVNGNCTAPQDACQFSSQCATGKLCADGACLDPCNATDGSCATGFACTKGVCEPSATGTGGDGGTTGPTTCTDDPTCGTGKFCNNGVCVVDTRPQPNCTGDTDCGGTASTPKKCLAGYCKYTCTNDQYCRTIDSRIGYCATDGVCRSSTEANPQCTGPGTCPLAGQDCIDNQCK